MEWELTRKELMKEAKNGMGRNQAGTKKKLMEEIANGMLRHQAGTNGRNCDGTSRGNYEGVYIKNWERNGKELGRNWERTEVGTKYYSQEGSGKELEINLMIITNFPTFAPT